MRTSLRFADHYLPTFSNNWTFFFLWGVLLVGLGCFAIIASTLATLISVIVLGFIIFFSGAVILVDTASFWWGKWGGFLLHLLVALLYLFIGLILIFNPVEGSSSLTLLLGIFYLVVGALRIGYSTSLKAPRWGWLLFNGIITLILGFLILVSWPASSLFIIGLFVGIDLIFLGWAYIMSAMAGKKFLTQAK